MKTGYDKFFTAARKAKEKQPARFKKQTDVENQLRQKMRMQPARRKKAPFPFLAMAITVAGLGLSGWAMLNPGWFEEIISKVEVNFMGMAQAESAQPKKEEAAKTSEAKKTDEHAKAATPNQPSAEDLNHYAKLNERQKELDLREKELGELEEELHKQRVEVEARIKKLEEMRTQIASILKDRVDVDEDKVNKLVEFYSNMKAKQAAEILGTLNEDLAVEVLGKMKKKNAAEIMNLLPPPKAQTLSEKFAGYKRR